MNRRHDFAKLEREYVTSDISIRELCRRHGISAHSLVTVQAKRHEWAAKREAYQARASESFIEKHADRMADRQAEIHDDAVEAIAEAMDKFRADLKATKKVRQPDGSVTEQPAWLMTPRDLCLIIDRFQVLFDRPSIISQHQGLSITCDVSAAQSMAHLQQAAGDAVPPVCRQHRDGVEVGMLIGSDTLA